MREARPSILWTAIVVLMLGAFTSLALRMTGYVVFGDLDFADSHWYSYALFILFMIGLPALAVVRSVVELQSLAQRWDSLLAQPIMWTLAIGCVMAFIIAWARERPWESQSIECAQTCVKVTQVNNVEAVVVGLVLSLVIAAFVAAASVLIYTWRDMRPGL